MQLPRAFTRFIGQDRRADVRVSLLLLAIALVLYVPGIWWGLPHATGPDRIHPWGNDEIAPLGPFAQTVTWVFHSDARFDPRYPLLPYVLQAIAMLPYLAWQWLVGRLGTFSAAFPFGFTDPVTSLAGLTLWARVFNLLLVSAIPVIAYWTALRLWSRTAALMTAPLVLLMYHMFFYSRTSNVDGAMLFFAALGLLVYAACLRDGVTTPRAIALGVFAALTTAAKDPGYALFAAVAVVLAVLALRRGSTVRGSRWEPWRVLLVGLIASIVVYAVAAGFVFSPDLFLQHVDYTIKGSGLRASLSEPATLEGYRRVFESVARHVTDAVGAPVLALSATGLVLAAMRDRAALLFAVPALGLLAGVILPTRYVMFRYVLPAVYVLPFFAGYFLAWLAQRDRGARRATAPRGGRGWSAARACFALAALWSLVRGADLTYQMLFDSRNDLGTWMRANAQAGDRVAFYGGSAKLPALDSGIVVVPGPYWNGRPTPDPDWPEFFILIPQQVHEREHESQLPEDRYAALRRGEWPYQLVYASQTPRLFAGRPITWVNPPVRVFARNDVARRLPPAVRRIDIETAPPPALP